jgi:hypothetical protein
MYINKIDELIDNLLDDFNKKLIKSKLLDQIKKEPNFVKFQNNINIFIKNFIESIDKVPITKLLPSTSNVSNILSIMTRYIAYYIYLSIAYNYFDSRDLYITNIIECSKNQKSSVIQINDFFNSENNAILIKFYTIIKNIIILANLKSIEKIQLTVENNPNLYSSTILLFNSLGQTYIENHFLIPNNMHNIIKTIIFRELYLKQEKVQVYDLLTQKEKDNAEYRFIEIVVSKKDDKLDYNTIEKLFSIQERREGLVDDIYNFLLYTNEKKQLNFLTNEEKTKILFDNNIIIPITEDFLRYHKNTETYDNIGISQNVREKDDTKLKYIVTKMNAVRNYYSPAIQNNNKLKIETQKIFYKPLNYRHAVLYNDYEEVRLLKKLENIGKKNTETDYLIDLLGFRKYAYQNFKDFNNDGIRLKITNNIPVIRYCNLEFMDKKKVLQYRVSSKDMDMMTVGVAFQNSKIPIQCAMSKQLLDVRKLLTSSNGYKAFKKVLKERFSKESNKIFYWIFDNKKDKPDTKEYKNISSNNIQQNIFILLSSIYDNILVIIENKIIEKMSNTKSMSMMNFHNIIDKYSNDYICLYKHPEIINKLFKYFVDNKLPKTEEGYDTNEDIIPGLNGKNIIKLPKYIPPKNTKNIIKLGIIDDIMDSENKYKPKNRTICQHNISWINIMKMNKRRVTEFNQEIFNFVKKYVRENENSEYICKSCSEVLSIKKFVYEGSYDKSSGSFITTSMALDTNLEELPEYEKFTKTIKNLDKIIEKICYTSNLMYYVGSTYTNKIRRKTIVKEVIDTLLQHNKVMKNSMEERINGLSKYGIEKNFTNFFVFSLQDDIFITSSKDTDYYKTIKYNNIIVYILFSIIIDINAGQISGLTYEKKCNFFIFKQYGIKLFKGLKIRINNANDIKDIDSYPTLCYLIYYFSCILIQFKIWLFQDMNKGGFHPHIQKSIVHTLVDLINSILLKNTSEDKNFLYEILTTRFFIKLETIYNDTELLDVLELQSSNNITLDKTTNKITFSKSKYNDIDIGPDNNLIVGKSIQHNYCDSETKEINKNYLKLTSNKIDFLTNCKNGEFHEWKYKNNTLRCIKCNKSFQELEKENKNIKSDNEEQILFKIKLINLAKIAKKYCISGELHDIQPETGKCNKCKIEVNNYLFSEKELIQLENNLKKNKNKIILQEIEKQENLVIENKKNKIKTDKILNKIKTKFSSNYDNDIKKIIHGFVKKLENILGKSITIEVDKKIKEIFINKTIFYIDHDYIGDKLKKKIIISDDDNKIKYKSDDKFFKTDVIYYFDKSNGVDVYYNAITNHLIGYKETNKDYKINNKTDNYLKIDLSLKDQLYLLGYVNKYIHINQDEYDKVYLISDIIRSRIRNLKNIIIMLQKIIQRIKYNPKNVSNDSLDRKINEIINNYSKKINNLKLDKNNKKQVFKNWEKVQHNLYFDKSHDFISEIKNIQINGKYISTNLITKTGNNDNSIIFYIIKQLNRLLTYNNSKYDEINVASLIISSIHYCFNKFYNDKYSLNINKFKIILETDITTVDETTHNVGLYNELVTTEDLEDPEMTETMEENVEINTSMDLDDNDEYDDDDYIEEYEQ